MFTLSPAHTDAYYTDKAGKISASPDIDTILFYDTAGVLNPDRMRTLFPAVMEKSRGKPIEFHSNNIPGTSAIAYVEAIKLGVTIDRKCGSTQQAIDFAAQGIIAGVYDLVVAGGVEMMSRVPMKANRLGKDNLGPMFHAVYPDGLVYQGISAELIAARWQLGRPALDQFALRSHSRAAAAEASGPLAWEITPIDGVACDEGIRADSSIEKLGSLRTSFEDSAMAARFSEIRWSVTAGNASQVSYGASALLLTEEKIAERMGLKPRTALSHFALMGDDPIMILTGIIPATKKLLQRASLGIDEIDRFEVNEAFASVVLAWLAETGADPARVNVDGGAIAFSHPVGASGGRLMMSLLRGLEELGGRRGLITMCKSGGMANASLIERLG